MKNNARKNIKIYCRECGEAFLFLQDFENNTPPEIDIGICPRCAKLFLGAEVIRTEEIELRRENEMLRFELARYKRAIAYSSAVAVKNTQAAGLARLARIAQEAELTAKEKARLITERIENECANAI